MKVSTKILIIVLFGFSQCAFAQCKKIQAEIKAVDTQNGVQNGKISLDFKQSKIRDFEVSIFGPQKMNKKMKVDETEIKDLTKGKYLIVIVGKREEDNFCPKSMEVTVN